MSFLAEATLQTLGAEARAGLGHYVTALNTAFADAPPLYGTKRYGDLYRREAADPQWIAESLITSAEAEGVGASRLWTLAACSDDQDIAGYVKQHAIDEGRHARWYIALLDITFPGAVEDAMRPRLKALSPRYEPWMTPEPVKGSTFAYAMTVDDLIQSNIVEIRTWVNQQLQRPVLLAYCEPERRRKLTVLLDRLARDEIDHIAYTARLIQGFAQRDGLDSILDLFVSRVREFNQVTCSEVEDRVFPLHCSNPRCRDAQEWPTSCPLASL